MSRFNFGYNEPLPDDYSTEEAYREAIENFDYEMSDRIDDYIEESRREQNEY